VPVDWMTISLLRPEIVLLAAASAIFIAGAFTRNRAWWAGMAIAAYVLSALVLAKEGWPWEAVSIATGPVMLDALSLSLRWMALLIGVVFTLLAAQRADAELASESLGCLMLVSAGAMLVASANELVFLFLSLELISIPTYVLLFLGRRDRASGEATMKYFFLSILSSALLLYGLSFLYGLGHTTLLTGTVAHPGIREAFASMQSQAGNVLAPLAPLPLVLIIAGLGFKLTVAPLQFYAPDVYQGTTNLNAGLLAVAPKIAGAAALIRVVIVAMPGVADFAWQIAIVLAVVTMTIGNVCALWQKNLRRMLAYSSIAHGGYLLIGLAAATATNAGLSGNAAGYGGGISAMLLHVLAYGMATMGAFAALAYLSSPQRELSGVDDLAGLSRSQPLVAGALTVFLISLTGLPPLAGFWGKLSLFASAIRLAMDPAGGTMAHWFLALAIAAALNAAIAAAYYLRLVATMYFQPAGPELRPGGGACARFAMALLAILVVAFGLLPGRLVQSTQSSEADLQPAIAGQTLTAESWPDADLAQEIIGR
jgi:NADH-quinone oxidoreductase subunit N